MNELTRTDLHFVVSRIPKDVQALIKEYGLMLGGGFIRATIAGEKISDLDIFGPDSERLEKAAYKIASERKGKIHKTDNAFTVLASPRMPLQFITRWLFSRAEDVVQSFDFTVCQAAVYFEKDKWLSTIAPEFYPDLAAKRLVYVSPIRSEDAGGSMMRILKYLKRGYSIQAPSLAKVIARLVGGVTEIEKLDEAKHGLVIGGLLRQVDPLTLVDGIDIVDEHQVEGAVA